MDSQKTEKDPKYGTCIRCYRYRVLVSAERCGPCLGERTVPPAEPSCEDWPECALDDDRCAAVAVMGRGRCPRLSPGGLNG